VCVRPHARPRKHACSRGAVMPIKRFPAATPSAKACTARTHTHKHTHTHTHTHHACCPPEWACPSASPATSASRLAGACLLPTPAGRWAAAPAHCGRAVPCRPPAQKAVNNPHPRASTLTARASPPPPCCPTPGATYTYKSLVGAAAGRRAPHTQRAACAPRVCKRACKHSSHLG